VSRSKVDKGKRRVHYVFDYEGLRFRKQGGHRTHFNAWLADVAGRWFGLRAFIKDDDRVDPAFGKG